MFHLFRRKTSDNSPAHPKRNKSPKGWLRTGRGMLREEYAHSLQLHHYPGAHFILTRDAAKKWPKSFL
jgi:hypothetical protein